MTMFKPIYYKPFVLITCKLDLMFLTRMVLPQEANKKYFLLYFFYLPVCSLMFEQQKHDSTQLTLKLHHDPLREPLGHPSSK